MEGSQKHDRKRRTSKEKTTYCFIPFLWNFRKGETIGTENRSVDSWGECWVSRGKYQQWWLQERSFYGAGNISVLRVVMFTGLCPVTQFSSDFTLKVGEFHCIQLSLVAMCWTLWKEQEWVPRGQLGGWGVSPTATFQTVPLSNCFAAGESDGAHVGDLVSFQLTMIRGIKSPPGSGHYLHLWLVPKDVIGLTEILSTKQSHFHGDQYPLKPKEFTGFIHCNLISLGLCFFVCKGEGLTTWPPKTLWALTACDFKVQCRLDLSFYL